MKIAIASGKGGTGKTTLSTNLASYLSDRYKILLADLDVEEPNSGLFISGKLSDSQTMYKMIPAWDQSSCTLCGNCQEVCNYNSILKLGEEIMVFPDLCHGCFACAGLCPSSALTMVPVPMGKLSHSIADGFTFIESRLDVGQEQATPLISQTHDYIDENFSDIDIHIYDAPPGTSCPVIEATKEVDYVILVTEPTPFGLHDLKLAVDTIRGLKKAFGVVINRHGIGNDDVITYCQQERIPVLTKIPNDRKIAELYSSGQLIYRQHPEFKKALEAIREKVIPEATGGRG